MAKRDILARAMSVPPVRVAPEADLGVAGSTSPAEASAQPKAKTAPGVMMNFMVERSDVHRELSQAKAKLQEYEGAQIALNFDPRKIKPSKWANRSVQSFDTKAYAALKAEIGAAGGNVQPIKIRRVAQPSDGAEFEVVFGHRRHRACLELGLPVLALVVEAMEDRDLYAEMDRENRFREDLSAWEQGRSYTHALEEGLYPSLRKLAEALDLDPGNVSRAIAIGQLPDVVVAAFSSPVDIQFRWGAALRDAQQRDPEGLIARAKELAALENRLGAAEIFKRLTSPEPKNAAKDGKEWVDANGKPTARLEVDAKGRAKLAFLKPLTERQREALAAAVDQLLG